MMMMMLIIIIIIIIIIIMDRLQNKCTNCNGVKNQFWTSYWNTRETGYNM